MEQIMLRLAMVLLSFIATFTVAQAGAVYEIHLAGDSTAIGMLDWAGDLSSDGVFPRASSDINALSVTVNSMTFTTADEDGLGSAENEVEGGELVRFDANFKWA